MDPVRQVRKDLTMVNGFSMPGEFYAWYNDLESAIAQSEHDIAMNGYDILRIDTGDDTPALWEPPKP